MNDISYEILDLFKKYGADKEGILKILEADSRPEVLYALSDIRRNLMDWMDFSGQEHVLQLGSDYGVITGLLAERCASVAVVAWPQSDCLAIRTGSSGSSVFK